MFKEIQPWQKRLRAKGNTPVPDLLPIRWDLPTAGLLAPACVEGLGKTLFRSQLDRKVDIWKLLRVLLSGLKKLRFYSHCWCLGFQSKRKWRVRNRPPDSVHYSGLCSDVTSSGVPSRTILPNCPPPPPGQFVFHALLCSLQRMYRHLQ